MNLLAIDTATEKMSIALAASNDTWSFEADAGLRHSELVMDSVDMLMRRAALRPEDLSGVVCMGGPGSFTGLRIGFAVAKGLALSLGIPFVPIPTLDCLAWPFSAWPGIIVPVLDAKHTAFFCALYQGGKRLCPDMDSGPEEILNAINNAGTPNQALLIGPGAGLLHERLGDSSVTWGKDLPWGNALTLLRMACRDGFIARNSAGYDRGPEYIRKSDAELSMADSRH